MKQKITLFLMVVIFGLFNSHAQTQFWSDSFEDAGAPSSGTRTPEGDAGTGTPYTTYFARTNNTSIQTMFSASGYQNSEGAKFWAGEDHDTHFGAGKEEMDITWTGINVSGKTGLSFRGLFAANNINAPFENTVLGSSHSDYVIVEYRFNGTGGYTRLLGFFANNNVVSGTDNKSLALDTDGDSVGNTPTLSGNFAEFQGNIVGTGTTIDIRIRAYSNGTSEEWAIDNFRLFETPPCVAPTITAQPPNRSICNNANTTFPITATGATGYQWQVNTGSGFTDITNGGVYTNATTSTLNITGATSGMNGYLYRCVTYNPTIACFTNTNQATLTISNINTSAGSQTNVTCNGGNNGSATITPSGGIAPYTYSWSPSGGTAATASGLTANSYTVTVTDNIGCTATRNFIITQPPALVLNANSQTNVACFGGNTGAASVNTATGGTPGYTYNWTPGNPTGDGTTSVTGLTSGTWTCTVTDANGCTAVRNFTVTQPPAAVSGTTVVTNVACFGGNTGAINLTPTGGVGPYTFNWGGGITTEDRTTLTAGNYSVTITDANGCTGTVNATVTQPAAAVSGTTVVTNVACFGGNTGAINLTPTGGVGPYTFNWGGGITTEDRTTLTAGNYSVTITDANGCTGTVNATVTQPAAAVSGTTVVTNVACFGGNTGAINLTPTGGVGPYTFNWGGGITTEDRTTLTAGNYSVTITDANGCTGTVNATVTQPAAAVSGTTVVTNVACFGGNTGAINLTPTGGVGPYTFNWGGGITTEDRTTLTAGNYSVTITDANGCTGTVNANVTQPAAAVSGTTVVTNVACFGGNTGAINLTPTGGVGPYTFNWGGGITTEDRTTLTAGNYSVTITDANGCTGTVNATVTQPAAAVSGTTVVTNVACFGGNTGAINLTPTGGVGPYTFNWGGGITTEDRTTLTAGNYSVTITDANGCTGTVNATVTQPAAAVSGTTVVTNVACFGGNTGAINLTPTGGVGPYTFNWGGGITTEDRTGLAAGSYSVTITDANGCTGTVSGITVTQPAAAVSGTTLITNVSCFGGNNGVIDLTPTGGTGPYTYNWGGGITTEDRTSLTPGTYSVTITDSNGCTGTLSGIMITQPVWAVNGTTIVTNIACFGGNTGVINLTPTGGSGPYTYDWGGGITTEDRTALTAGSYSVTITDSNGCTGTISGIMVTQPTALAATAASQTDVACNGGSNGSAAINTPTGGAGGYTYNWTPGNPTGDGTTSVSGLTAGSWTCTITDANSCTTSVNFTITEPTAIDSNVTQAAGILTAIQSGATYQWYTCPNTILTGETNQTYIPTVVGDYKVDITLGGCTVTSNCITVTVLGNDDFDLFSKFKMYPNPNNGILTVETKTDGNFVIVNQLGQIVENFSAKANTKTTINIEKLSDGTYFVKGNKGTNIPTKKLVIKK
ncbi:T9SS type A sorting domain-containing protein [Flavobacterium amniphilum]|uniref:beta strand repeat-containing protein n=1 Tax=Flavobacterium amniphilum TaxID=1834035 RepID=UPI00202A6E9C|nr:T9SS type A sorting domain-containing protein [Flavobacterium amniphilum]MCL9807205.1 T9SS type A sorting domain-containing protein [Flavobacterium amniphilum]